MHKTIAATGAVPGEYVNCVAETSTAKPGRFNVGQSYKVVDFCGTPSAHGHTDFRALPGDRSGKSEWLIPWMGHGWLWERA